MNPKQWSEIEVGDEVVHPVGYRVKVLMVSPDKKVFLRSCTNVSLKNWETSVGDWLLVDQAERNGWKLEGKAERWKPENVEEYFFPCPHHSDVYGSCLWRQDEIDRFRMDNNLVFRTKEEAIAASEVMLDSIKNRG